MSTEAHQQLTRPLGEWVGEVIIPSNPDLPEGAKAESRILSTWQLNGWKVVSEYEQTGLAETPYTAHRLYGWDPKQEKYTFYWFDSDGWDPGAPALGDWDGDTLQFTETTTMGPTRFTYTFEGKDHYTLKVENSTNGQDWKLLFTEHFRRTGD